MSPPTMLIVDDDYFTSTDVLAHHFRRHGLQVINAYTAAEFEENTGILRAFGGFHLNWSAWSVTRNFYQPASQSSNQSRKISFGFCKHQRAETSPT